MHCENHLSICKPFSEESIFPAHGGGRYFRQGIVSLGVVTLEIIFGGKLSFRKNIRSRKFSVLNFRMFFFYVGIVQLRKFSPAVRSFRFLAPQSIPLGKQTSLYAVDESK